MKTLCFYDVAATYDLKKDPMFKIKLFAERLIENSRKLYYPHRELCIDESMIPYKGEHQLRRFMPKKPIRYLILI